MTAPTPDLAALLAQLAQVLAERRHEPEPPQVSTARPLPPRVLFTVEEAAEQLGIGRSLAYRLIRNGDLESVQVGRLRRVPASAISEYAQRLIAQQSVKKSA